jgi:hypothetical protein
MTWIIEMSVLHEGNSSVTISFTAETNPKGMLKITRRCKPPVMPGIK